MQESEDDETKPAPCTVRVTIDDDDKDDDDDDDDDGGDSEARVVFVVRGSTTRRGHTRVTRGAST